MATDSGTARVEPRIIDGGRAALWPWWHLEVEARAWVLWCNDRDGAGYRVGRRRAGLPAGRVTVLRPGTRLRTEPGPDVCQVFLTVDLVGLSGAEAEELAPGPVLLPADPVLGALVAALHADLPLASSEGRHARRWNETLVTRHSAHALVHRALACLVEQAPTALRRRLEESADRQRIAPALTLIERELGRPLSVEGLAAVCGMQRQWFSATFTRAVGQSPKRYLLERRVAVAAQRLALGRESLEAIAEACGFADRAHFAKTFARLRGTPPARFRREARRERAQLSQQDA